MARREAGAGGSGYSGQLADMEAYTALIQAVEQGNPYEDGGIPIKVVLQLSDNADDTLFAWITAVRPNGKLILGKNKTTGKYSGLRRFVCAALGVPVETEVEAFDDETGYAWLKDGREGPTVGRYVVFRGENVEKDGNRRFNVSIWQPYVAPGAQRTTPSPAAQFPGMPAPQGAAQPTADDADIPF